MDRAGALTFLQQAGFSNLMRAAGRTEIDSPTGYGPAIDDAFAYYEQLRPNEPVADTVRTEDVIGFKVLLRATTLDLLEPTLCSFVDTQVDAPLTNTKGSQLCKQIQAMRLNAWNRAASVGYGGMNEVGGFRANLDFIENHGSLEE